MADRPRRTAGWARGFTAVAATAAALLVAFGPVWLGGDGGRDAAGRHKLPLAQATATPQDPRPEQSGELSPEAVARMWQATGRNLATLPLTVKRVAAHPETDRIVGHIRPLAEPVGAAWEVLLRTWPGGTTSPTAAIPETDTGHVLWQQALHV